MTGSSGGTTTGRGTANRGRDRTGSWQLGMFERSLKKRQKLDLLLEQAAPLSGRRCLLLTNGDNNGALNYRFREAGGEWTWGDFERKSIPGLERFLGEPVRHARPIELPFPDAAFDRVVVIDVHEHLEEVDPVNRELARVLAPGGRLVVTTPNGDSRLPVAVIKRWVGMGPEEYGHVVQGYRREELERMVESVGLAPVAAGAYSRFFTELLELGINFAYVKLLGGRDEEGDDEIAPATEEDLEEVGGAYRAYALVYPVIRAVSCLDALLPGDGGYAVSVVAEKPR